MSDRYQIGPHWALWILKNECHLSAAEIGERIGTTRAMVGRYLNNQAIPSRGKEVLILRALQDEIKDIVTVERKGKLPPFYHQHLVNKVQMLKELIESQAKTLDRAKS